MGGKADPFDGVCPRANTQSPVPLNPFGLTLGVLGHEFFNYLWSKETDDETSGGDREGNKDFVVPDIVVASPDDIEERGHDGGINETRSESKFDSWAE